MGLTLMPKNDGKNKFYRNLDLDSDTMKLIYKYKKIKEQIDKEVTSEIGYEEND